MPPAFSSTKQAAAFALLLLFLLAAPWLAHKTFLPQREQTYSSQSIRWEKNPWAQKLIFQETNDIDIAFIGSSHIACGINTPYVQQKLDERLGHKTVVRTLFFAYPGFDALYFLCKDLLSHRRVKMLVFYDEFGPIHYEVHHYAPNWYRFGDGGEVMAGLPLRNQAVYYYAAMIGMPRILLELFVSNLPNDPTGRMTGGPFDWHVADPEMMLGGVSKRLGFDPVFQHPNTNFIPYVPQNKITPADVCTFTPATAAYFVFSNQPEPVGQLYFAKQFGLLAKAHGCNLVALHMPVLGGRASQVITEPRKWPDLLQDEVCLIGIPAARLFSGLDESEIKKLYFEPGHLNENGQKYFTSLITPALINNYERHSTNSH